MKYIILFLYLLLVFSSCQDTPTLREQRELDMWLENVSLHLRPGDLVFRKGVGLAGRMVALAGGSDEVYSHIGIVVTREDTVGWFVCHAVPGEPDFEGDEDRVKCEPLQSFYATDKASKGKVMRVACSDSVAELTAVSALHKWRRHTLFDHEYNWEDTIALYCTQLIARVYAKQGIDLVEDRNHPTRILGFNGVYIFPSDIENSALLEQISYY